MDEITIVRKRSRLLPILLALVLLAVIALVVFWLMGSQVTTDVHWNDVIDMEGRLISGTA